MTTVLYVPGIPVAQPRQRTRVVMTGKRAFATNYTPRGDPSNAFKAAVARAAHDVHQGKPLLEGPLAVELVFILPRPKGKTTKRGPNPMLWAPRKPDWENLGKSTCDALNGVLWVDDAQICLGMAWKVYAGPAQAAGTLIRVQQLDGLPGLPEWANQTVPSQSEEQLSLLGVNE